MKFAFISGHRSQYPVRFMCRVLEVSPSGYYAWCKRRPSRRQQENQKLLEKIRLVHAQSRRTYGSPRVHAELKAQGIACGRHRVERLMHKHQIQAKQVKRRVRTTWSGHGQPVAPNLLERNFQAAQPNQKWVSDLTYIPTAEGWLYLATVMDLYSRRIIGWSMDSRMTCELVCRALEMALLSRKPKQTLVHHSDRGSQYASRDYRQLLERHGVQASMSGTGNCYDNAAMESFFGTLKTELIYHCLYSSRTEARSDIFAYIEGFYNRQRRHSSLDFQSPEDFERLYYASLSYPST
jgi:putative transposase